MAINKARTLAQAQKYLQRNNIDRALKELEKIVRADPKDLRARQKIAEVLARQGRNTEAMKEFQVVADTYERDGFYPKAAAIYKQMLRIDPDQMELHLAVGEIYQHLALLSDAMDHFNIVAEHFEANGTTKERTQIYKRLISLHPESVDYTAKLSEIYHKEADPQGAVDVWRHLAATLKDRGISEPLAEVYENLVRLSPEDTVLARKLADIYLDRGEPQRALSKLQACFKQDNQDTETLNLLADCFVDLGEKPKAIAVLKELARIYDDLGYEDFRNQVFDRIAEISPTEGSELSVDSRLDQLDDHGLLAGIQLKEELAEDLGRLVVEGEILLEYGLYQRAETHYRKAAASHPGVFAFQRGLALLLAQAEPGEDLLKCFDTLYEIAMSKNAHRVAHAALKRMIDVGPEDPERSRRLAEFEEAMGEFVTEEQAIPEVSAVDELGYDLDLDQALDDGLMAELEIASFDEVDRADLEGVKTLADGLDALDDDEEDEVNEVAPAEAEPAPVAEEAAGDDLDVDDLLAGLGTDDEDGDEDDGLDFDFDDAAIEQLAAELDGDLVEVFDSGKGGAGDLAGDSAAEAEPKAEAKAAPGPEAKADGVGEVDDDLFGLGDLDDIIGIDDIDDVGTSSAYELGRSYLAAGSFDDAVIELKRAVSEDDHTLDSLELLGSALRRTRDLKGAIKVYKDLLGLGKASREVAIRITYELGVTYEAAGSKAGAVQLFEKVVRADPEFRQGELKKHLESLKV